MAVATPPIDEQSWQDYNAEAGQRAHAEATASIEQAQQAQDAQAAATAADRQREADDLFAAAVAPHQQAQRTASLTQQASDLFQQATAPLRQAMANPRTPFSQPTAPAMPGGSSPDEASALQRVYQDARQAGLDDEGARVAQAVARTEHGYQGAVGDAGVSAGTFQLHHAGGMGNAYAASQGLTPEQSIAALRADPHAANQWALSGYLGQAIREGQQRGLHGAELATYAQQYGQRSVSPERAGASYTALQSLPGGGTADFPVPGGEAVSRPTGRGFGAARAPSRSEAVGQFEQGLDYAEAAAICGPVAALAFVQANGRNPSLAEVRALAVKRGWTTQGGMNGIANEQGLLQDLGVKSRLDTNPDFGEVAHDAASGNPVIVSTPVHYYYANAYDPATGRLFVGKTGTSRRGGGSWMTPQQIADLDGGVNGVLYVDNPQSPQPSVASSGDTSGERPPSEFEAPSRYAERDVSGTGGAEADLAETLRGTGFLRGAGDVLGGALGTVQQGFEKVAAPFRAGIPDPRSAVGNTESPGTRIARAAQASMLEHPEWNIFQHLGAALDQSTSGYQALREAGPQVDPSGGLLSGAANTVLGLGTQPLTTIGGLGGRVAEAGTVGGGLAGAGYGLATGAGPVGTAQAIETGANIGGMAAPLGAGTVRRVAPVAAEAARGAVRGLALEGGPTRELGAVAGGGTGRARPVSDDTQALLDFYRRVGPDRAERIRAEAATEAARRFGKDVSPAQAAAVLDEIERLLPDVKTISHQVAPYQLRNILEHGELRSKFNAGLDEEGIVRATADSVAGNSLDRFLQQGFPATPEGRLAGAADFVERERTAHEMVTGSRDAAPPYARVTEGQTLPDDTNGLLYLVMEDGTPRITAANHHFAFGSPGYNLHSAMPQALKRVLWGTRWGEKRLPVGDGRTVIDTPWMVGPDQENTLRAATLLMTAPEEVLKAVKAGTLTDPADVAAAIVRGSKPRGYRPMIDAAKRAGFAETDGGQFDLGASLNANRSESLLLDPDLGDVRAIYVVGNDLDATFPGTAGIVGRGGLTSQRAAELVQQKIKQVTGKDVPILRKDVTATGSKLAPEGLSVAGRGPLVERYTRAGFPDIGATAPDVLGRLGRGVAVAPENVAGAVAGGVAGYEAGDESESLPERAGRVVGGALLGAAGVRGVSAALRGRARPPPGETIRLYHGGAVAPEGGFWFTPQRERAAQYAAGSGGAVWSVDVPAAQVAALSGFDPSTGMTLEQHLAPGVQLPAELVAGAGGAVRGALRGLGLETGIGERLGAAAGERGAVSSKLAEEASTAPASSTVFGQFWNRARNVIGQQGEAGQELAGKIHAWRESAERLAGEWAAGMPTVRSLTKDEFRNFVAAAEGKAQAGSERIAKAVEEWGGVRTDAYNRAKAAGLDIGKLEDYWPHVFEEGTFSGKGWSQALDHLVQSGQAATRAEAAQLLRYAQNVRRNRRYGNLEAERTLDLPFYRQDKGVLFGQGGYLEAASNRIAQVAHFGEKDADALALIDKIGQEGFDADAAKALFDISVGATRYGELQQRASRMLRGANTVASLGLSAINNAGQIVNTATVAGMGPTARNLVRSLRSPEAKEAAIRAGVTLDNVIQDVREGTGLASRALQKITAPGFGTVERFQRTLAFHAGVDYAQDAATKAAAGDRGALAALQRLGLDAKEVAQRGVLTDEEKITAGRNIVERTQFKVDPQDLPGWSSSPMGKLVTQFKSFSYNQSAFMGREVLGPALRRENRDLAPLARFLVAGLAAGAATTETRNLIQGREPEQDPVKRILQYYTAVGALGLAGDVLRVTTPIVNINADRLDPDRVVTQAVGTALGPTVGKGIEVLSGISQATRGNPTPLERTALRQIPVVGTTLQNLLVPYKPRTPASSAPAGRNSTAPPAPPKAPAPPRPPAPPRR